jgi:hypothetical protein
MSSGTGTAKGNTLLATETLDLTSSGCTGDDTEGPDVFFKVSLTANQDYKITVDPESGYNNAIYILSDCNNPTTKCLKGADSEYSGTAEVMTFKPTSNGMYIIGVDSRYAVGDTNSAGEFVITVEEIVVPGNNTCAGATALTFSGGTATASGDTGSATNEIQLTSSGCTGWSSPGPDVFYSVQLQGGTTYTVTLTPGTSFDSMVYVFTDCANPESTCVAGDDTTAGPDVVTFTPSSTGTFYIGVDSYDSSETGTFSLEVK